MRRETGVWFLSLQSARETITVRNVVLQDLSSDFDAEDVKVGDQLSFWVEG